MVSLWYSSIPYAGPYAGTSMSNWLFTSLLDLAKSKDTEQSWVTIAYDAY